MATDIAYGAVPGNISTLNNRNDLPDTYRNGNLSFTGNAGNFFNQNTQSDNVTRNNLNNSSQNSRKGPKYPQYSITCIRLSTFQTWPSSIQQHPETMAEAGFYYTGNNDHVRCFYCGIGLQNWDSEDNPFVEHARWSAECQYLREKKGLDFITTVQDAVRRFQLEEAMNTDGVAETFESDFEEDCNHGTEDKVTELLPSGKPPTKAEKKNPLLTDAAQSILTMGYLPKYVKIIVNRVLQEKGWVGLKSRNLMEEIYRMEESGEIPQSEMLLPAASKIKSTVANVKKNKNVLPEADDSIEETEVKVSRMAAAGEDWRTGKSLIECNRYMLDNQIHCDVIFNVKSTMILAHGSVLMGRSEVFEKLIVGQASSNIILIRDVEPVVFNKMLFFIYCDSVDVDESDCADLLTAARNYKISGLEQLCLQKMKTGVSIESVCIVLNHAADSQLIQKCMDFIFKYPQQVMATEGFLELKPQHLKTIVGDDKFNVKEELIFETLMKWSVKECQRQNILGTNQNQVVGDIIKLIRFGLIEHKYLKEKCKPLLTSDVYVDIVEQLAEVEGNSGIIRRKRGLVSTPDDSNSVTSTLSTPAPVSRVFDMGASSSSYASGIESQTSVMSINSSTGPMSISPQIPQNTRVLHPRTNPSEPQEGQAAAIVERTSCIQPVEAVQRYSMDHRERVRLGYFIERDQRIIVERFESTKSGKAYTRENKDGISFIASQNLKLHGILMYGSHQRPGSYKIEMEILKDPGNGNSDLQRVYGIKTEMQTDGATKVYELTISPAVKIMAGKVYTIRALFKGQASFYGVDGQHTVLKNGLSVNFVTDTTCLNLTSREIGQFPGLIFEQVNA